jgi:hypothetical protein
LNSGSRRKGNKVQSPRRRPTFNPSLNRTHNSRLRRLAQIVGVHLPTLGDDPTSLQIFESVRDDWRIVAGGYQLMTRTVVFGEAGILPVAHLDEALDRDALELF